MQLTEGLNVTDHFRLVRELGRGGMGSVWLAEHTRLDALCAIKFIDREWQNSAEVRQRFQREAKAAAQLRSPHVVQILDHGVWENIPYIAMEYLEGEDLAHRLHRVGRLSWGETCLIVSHVARALSKAHAAGIVHRDVKPENIFLVRDDDSEVAKVLDFGIAQHAEILDDGATKTRSVLGTPFYMSPEQAAGAKRVDHRSDLFSLAVIVYQCLTGELPFYCARVSAVFTRITEAPMPVPSQKAADLPPSLDAWWARAAARDVDQRFESAKEFAEALARSLRVSDAVEITSRVPRTELHGSAGRISMASGSAAFASGQMAAGPTLALYETGEDSFARTFEPESTARRRKSLKLASAAVAAALLLGGALLLSRGNGAAPKAASLGGSTEVSRVTTPPAATPTLELAASARPAPWAADEKRSSMARASASVPPATQGSAPQRTETKGSVRKAKVPKTAGIKAEPDFGI